MKQQYGYNSLYILGGVAGTLYANAFGTSGRLANIRTCGGCGNQPPVIVIFPATSLCEPCARHAATVETRLS